MKLLLGLLLIGALAWVATFFVLPATFRRVFRSWQPDPLMARRVKRFREIPAGYGAFVLIVTAFVASMFLELYCNAKPLYVRYGNTVRYPAVASWLDFVVPSATFDASVPAKSFGLPHEGELDAREYARWVGDPALLDAEAARIDAGIVEDERRFRGLLAAEAKKRGLKYDPSAPLPPSNVEAAKEQSARAQALRALGQELRAGKARVVLPLYPYSPDEQLLDLPGSPPHKPFVAGFPVLGTDSAGRDVLSQLLYGFRISLAFGLIVALAGYVVGVMLGGAMGYKGGWFDILVQRGIEIWSAIPFLYTIMIIAGIIRPNFWVLAGILILLQAWIHITYYERGEFYREKARDYVQAARALGLGDLKIMVRHILPNALVPVVTFLPFDIVAFMSELVALDFLGFGLPPGTPSWGELLRQGSENIVNHPHLVFVPVIAFAGTLLCVVMIGEAVREAFDPKRYARLR